jgi:signal peptidase I
MSTPAATAPTRSSAGPWLLRGAAALVGVAVLGALAVVLLLPRLVHGAALTVRSGSMTPALSTGDLVVVRPVAATALHVGDIATYREQDGSLVTHRIVATDGSGSTRTFTFRGDANASADPQPVPAGAVEGRVWFSLPYLGTLRARLAEARPAIVVGGVLALGGYALVQFGSYARERRAAR